MTYEDVKTIILEELGRRAPEADLTELDPNADLREELDLDSMDFLNFVTALHERLDLDIPEVDYPNLFTFRHAVDYVAGKTGAVK
jgi:acyl carrier protein